MKPHELYSKIMQGLVTPPIYNRSNEYYGDYVGKGACGCIGPRHDEPLCQCMMANAKLPMSKEHVHAIEATHNIKETK